MTDLIDKETIYQINLQNKVVQFTLDLKEAERKLEIMTAKYFEREEQVQSDVHHITELYEKIDKLTMSLASQAKANIATLAKSEAVEKADEKKTNVVEDDKMIQNILYKLAEKELSHEQTAVLSGLLNLTDSYNSNSSFRLSQLIKISLKMSTVGAVDRRTLCFIASLCSTF